MQVVTGKRGTVAPCGCMWRFKRSSLSHHSYLSLFKASQWVLLIFTSATDIEALTICPVPARFQPGLHHFPVRTEIPLLSARNSPFDWL